MENPPKNKIVDYNLPCEDCNSKIHSVFHSVNRISLQELFKHKICTIYKKGQYIFNEKGFPQGLFCITKGKVKLCVTGSDGKEQILRLANSGDIIGYTAMLAKERYHCSAVALEDSSICIIEKNFFLEFVQNHPELLLEFIKKMTGDLNVADEKIVSLSQKNVRERMAEALLFFKTTYGINEKDQTLNIVLTREEIASYVGTSMESAIRLLSEFNQEGIIKLTGKKIKILNISELIKKAKFYN